MSLALTGGFFTTEPSGKSQRMLFLSLWNHGISSFPGGSEGKASAYNVGDPSSTSGSGRSPGEGNGNPLQFPGKFHGQRSLVVYSLWGHKESDTTERLHFLSLSKSVQMGWSPVTWA